MTALIPEGGTTGAESSMFGSSPHASSFATFPAAAAVAATAAISSLHSLSGAGDNLEPSGGGGSSGTFTTSPATAAEMRNGGLGGSRPPSLRLSPAALVVAAAAAAETVPPSVSAVNEQTAAELPVLIGAAVGTASAAHKHISPAVVAAAATPSPLPSTASSSSLGSSASYPPPPPLPVEATSVAAAAATSGVHTESSSPILFRGRHLSTHRINAGVIAEGTNPPPSTTSSGCAYLEGGAPIVWPFTPQDVEVLETMASHAAVAMRSAQLLEDMARSKRTAAALLAIVKSSSHSEPFESSTVYHGGGGSGGGGSSSSGEGGSPPLPLSGVTAGGGAASSNGPSSSSSSSMQALVLKIVDAAYTLLDCERVTLYLVDSLKRELWMAVAKDAQTVGVRIPIGVGLAGEREGREMGGVCMYEEAMCSLRVRELNGLF